MNEELKKQAEALEQTLRMQLSVAKNEQGDILKLGAAVLGGGILAFSLVRLFKGKKRKKMQRVMETLEREGLLDDDIRSRLRSSRSPGLLQRAGMLLLPILIKKGRERFLEQNEASE